MVTPLLHLGLGFDDLLVPALVEAGFATRDMVLIARTDANLSWVRKHAPGATVVRLPYAAARRANVVSGLAPHAALKRACGGVGLDILDLLVSERALRRNRVDTAMNFLNLAAEEIEAAVAGRGPVFALVEFTVTSELLTAGLVTHHGGLATWPRGLRLPSDRFGLFGAPKGITHWQRQVEDPAAVTAGEAFLEARRAGPSGRPPGYEHNLKVESGSEILRLATDRVKEFVADRGANLQLPKPSDYARLPWLNPAKARLNLREYRERRWDPLPERYVFLPLHVQPESSADVMGQEWRDQAYTARVLADALAPLDIAVAVKEHANFIWRRDPDYWPPFDAHPNIAAIDPHSDSRELMQHAVFTVTATGTVGLEAGLAGLPVVTGARMPWSSLANVAHLSVPDDLTAFVADRGWESLRADRSAIEEWFVHDYVRHSWEGVVIDPPRAPHVLEPANIARVGAALAEAAASLEPPSSHH
ncbi:hypothetical protein BA895_09415 [Humibacillus sp. DSM 29435]|uniref:hypothetical protein n=1 Tax=Humibacillus sp. DSM 29435 TaxID=1869167 RepID=UPI000872960C|nr:hypothetical protein [Humibacillus sp. DSM 29435]OFE14568.1 hypothetical protein BA895_09415 [Humibacillus sp. DSM 29435]